MTDEIRTSGNLANSVSDYVERTRQAIREFQELFTDPKATPESNVTESFKRRIAFAKEISDLLRNDNYTSAMFATEILPEGCPKGPFYADIAIKLAELSERKESKEVMSVDLIKRMIEYCKSKTEYFKE